MSELPASINKDRALANRTLAIKLGLVAVAFVGFGFALVPLYDVFCRMMGIVPGQAVASELQQSQGVDRSRLVNVEFTSQVMAGLPVTFYPMEKNIKVHPGEIMKTKYFVRNLTDQTIKAHAIYSVSPPTVGVKFHKIDCFCFKEQVLAVGESREMDVVFYVDATIAKNITDLSLSYAFYAQPANIASASPIANSN